jgi:hypothetical protein
MVDWPRGTDNSPYLRRLGADGSVCSVKAGVVPVSGGIYTAEQNTADSMSTIIWPREAGGRTQDPGRSIPFVGCGEVPVDGMSTRRQVRFRVCGGRAWLSPGAGASSCLGFATEVFFL